MKVKKIFSLHAQTELIVRIYKFSVFARFTFSVTQYTLTPSVYTKLTGHHIIVRSQDVTGHSQNHA